MAQTREALNLLTSSLALAATTRAKDYTLVRGLTHNPLDKHEVESLREAAKQVE